MEQMAALSKYGTSTHVMPSLAYLRVMHASKQTNKSASLVRQSDTVRSGHVLSLLLLEDELDEKLLQLLVAVVDAELLKPILRKDLKSVNVQHAKHDVLGRRAGRRRRRGQGRVDLS
jgi:hypothetical protein